MKKPLAVFGKVSVHTLQSSLEMEGELQSQDLEISHFQQQMLT